MKEREPVNYLTPNEVKCSKLVERLCKESKYNRDLILGSSKNAYVVQQRKEIACKVYATGLFSTPEIGMAMNRNHTSILNLINDITASRKRERYIQKTSKTVTRRNGPYQAKE